MTSKAVQRLVDLWNAGEEITAREVINLTPDDREAFYDFLLSPENAAILRKQIADFINNQGATK